MPKQPKKLLIVNILDILKKYTDENHRLSQREIVDLLAREYEMTVDRKAVRRNLMDLTDCGYYIKYSETTRITPNPKTGEPEENTILTDFYLQRDFSDGELRLLIDTLIASRHVPRGQCLALVEKLAALSSTHFRSQIQYIASMPQNHTDNYELFLTIEELGKAITRQKKTRFHYCEYGLDKKLHPRTQEDGTPREYVVTPYQLAVQAGKYYLICNYDKYNDISNYRLDRISRIEILDEPGKPFETLKWSNGHPLDLAAYMREHPYMYAGETVHAKLRVVRAMVGDMIDFFGKDIRFSDEHDGNVTVAVYANEVAVEQFARNYGPDVLVLEPEEVRDRIRASLAESLKNYE